MSNTHLNISMIAKEALKELKNELVFAKGANMQYSDEFAKKGAKIGNTINIRKPHRFSVTDGAPISIQATADKTEALVLNKRKHVAFQFSSQELTLNIDEFSKRYIRPAVSAIANQVDKDGLSLAKSNVFNSVGTPGTGPSTAAAAMLLALQAGQKLNEMACPQGDRSIVLNPAGQATFVSQLSSMFQSSEQLKKQYEKGSMGLMGGFNWKMDQNVPNHTTGQLGGTPKVKTTITDQGATSVATDGWTSAEANRMKAGDVFTMAGVYALNPVSGESTGSLQQFVVQADVDSDVSGEATITFLPAIYTIGQYKNVDTLPLDEAVILTFGHASSYGGKVSPANLAYHKDAFVFGCADLEMPKGVDMASRATDPDTGLSIRIVRDYDINNDLFPCRLDILYGWKAVYPELACRIHL